MTRDEARSQGLKRYEPLVPCVHGHTAERYTGNNDCVVCSYDRAMKYAANNRERARERASQWREDNPERHRENSRNQVARDPEENRDRANRWRRDNPERYKQNQRRAYERRAEAYKDKAKAWANQNPRRRTEIMARNRVKRTAAKVPLSPSDRDWLKFIYETCPSGFQVDHIHPINGVNFCGLHVPWNLQHLTPLENQRKSNKLPL